jgi:hypothetical protein
MKSLKKNPRTTQETVFKWFKIKKTQIQNHIDRFYWVFNRFTRNNQLVFGYFHRLQIHRNNGGIKQFIVLDLF